ncbi:MAG: preprotein translocase subunit SecY [Oscillospiraceae bacterium]|nr:preprotein translocase subunit SecY [Oscillospiraceae bacterium]
MFSTIRNAWAIPDLRKKLLYTIGLLIVFRLGSYIPVPGFDYNLLGSWVGEGTLLSLLDTMSGGALNNATIFAMGIAPYINASIIMQLLTVAVPAFERMQREGEEGRKKLAQYQRYGTVLLAIVQAFGLYTLLSRPGFAGDVSLVANPGWQSMLIIVISLTAGTAFLMWLGEQITEKGIGNGISLIIFAGIVSQVPNMFMGTVHNLRDGNLSYPLLIGILAVGLAVIGLIVMMNEAERRIPVQYAKRVVGRKMYGGQSTHIPIKVASAGVIPIIFAMSIIMFPATIAAMFGVPIDGTGTGFWPMVLSWLTPQHWAYAVLVFLLIIFFTYFYTAIQFNPVEMSNNMKKNGGFIPGIRPGRPTAEYIQRVLGKITMAGAIFIAFIAVFPIVMGLGFIDGMGAFAIGGAGLLIVVGVALETVRQLESQMLMRHYKGFLE